MKANPASPGPSRDWLTTSQAARLVGVHPSSVVRWIESGRLRALKTPGGHRRIPRQALEALWCEEREGEAR